MKIIDKRLIILYAVIVQTNLLETITGNLNKIITGTICNDPSISLSLYFFEKRAKQ